jgi:hypothetical protein
MSKLPPSITSGLLSPPAHFGSPAPGPQLPGAPSNPTGPASADSGVPAPWKVPGAGVAPLGPGPANGGGSGSGNGSGSSLSSPGSAVGEPTSPKNPLGMGAGSGKSPAASSPAQVIGNRDFVISIACYGDHVTINPGTKQHWWKSANSALVEEQIVRNVHELIVARQKSIAAGETPYRPSIRFRLAADGLASYLRIYPRLEFLQVPMTRENLED